MMDGEKNICVIFSSKCNFRACRQSNAPQQIAANNLPGAAAGMRRGGGLRQIR
jgi:hypothetical protein